MNEKVCSVEGCDNKDTRWTRGYCNMHYGRFLKYGDALADTPKHGLFKGRTSCKITKVCAECKQEKRRSEFYIRHPERDTPAMSARCKECAKAHATRWNRAHREHKLEAGRTYMRRRRAA
jgi:hypothetical protein